MHGEYVAGAPTPKIVERSAKILKVNSRFDRIDCKLLVQPNKTSHHQAFDDLSEEYFTIIEWY